MAVAAAGVLTAVTTANPPSKAEAYSSPSVWVGSPVDATWGTSVDTTPAGNHHKLLKAKPPNDWSVDLPTGGKASPVTLYVAPSNSAYNSNVTTRVTQIIDDNACKNGGGGDMVTVSIYFNGALYGSSTYAHLDRDPQLYVGKTIGRWGTTLGTVATNLTRNPECWTGPHVHQELRAETQYSCFNRGYAAGSPIRKTNFVGFISGPLFAKTQACA